MSQMGSSLQDEVPRGVPFIALFWAVWWPGVWQQEVGLGSWDLEPGLILGFLLLLYLPSSLVSSLSNLMRECTNVPFLHGP